MPRSPAPVRAPLADMMAYEKLIRRSVVDPTMERIRARMRGVGSWPEAVTETQRPLHVAAETPDPDPPVRRIEQYFAAEWLASKPYASGLVGTLRRLAG